MDLSKQFKFPIYFGPEWSLSSGQATHLDANTPLSKQMAGFQFQAELFLSPICFTRCKRQQTKHLPTLVLVIDILFWIQRGNAVVGASSVCSDEGRWGFVPATM